MGVVKEAAAASDKFELREGAVVDISPSLFSDAIKNMYDLPVFERLNSRYIVTVLLYSRHVCLFLKSHFESCLTSSKEGRKLQSQGKSSVLVSVRKGVPTAV